MAQVQVSDLTEILELKNVDFFHIKDGNDNIDKKFAFSNFLLPASNPTKQTVDSLGGAAFQNIVPVSMGGTGADNQATARNNLGLTSAATTPIGAGEGDLAVLGLNGFFSVNRIPNLDASKITSGVLSNTVLPTDIVRTSRTLTGGDGINTIGNLSANRTISVDSTVIRTSGAQSKSASLNLGPSHGKEFSAFDATDNSTNRWNYNANYAFAATASNNMMAFLIGGTENNRVGGIQVGHAGSGFADVLGVLQLNPLGGTVSTGSNLVVNGTIAANNLNVTNWNTAYSWGNHASAGYALASRTISAGDGLSGGGNLTANRSFSVDSTVARYGTTSSTVRTNSQNDGLFAQLDGGNWGSAGLGGFGYGGDASVPNSTAAENALNKTVFYKATNGTSTAFSQAVVAAHINYDGNTAAQIALPVGGNAAQWRSKIGGAWSGVRTLWDDSTLPDPARLGQGQTFTGVNTFTESIFLHSSIQNEGSNGVTSLLNGSAAGKLNVNELLVSNSYSDRSLVPTNGLYVKGNIVSGGTINGGALIVSAGAVGSYTFARQASAAFALKNYGDTQSGSNLTPADVGGASNGSQSSLSGTWVCLGNVTANFAEGSTTLWQRIS